MSRDDHYWKIKARKQRTDIRKFSFINRTTGISYLWRYLVSPAKAHTFSKRVRQVVAREGGEVICGKMGKVHTRKWREVAQREGHEEM
jgi:hypothetical protein